MRKAVCLALLLCGGLAVQAQVKGVKHVILIGMDGLGAYAIQKADNPVMKSMMKEGSWTLQARSVLPSSSAVNWASMIMGAGPELHGFTEWGSKVPEAEPREKDKYGMFPSVFTLLRAAKPNAEMGVFYSWDGIGYLFPKEAVNRDFPGKNDTATVDASIAYIKEKKPDFMFIHLHQPDETGHALGHDIPSYYEQVHVNDGLLGKLIQAVKDAGMYENSVIILSADHGGINKGHGGKTMREMQIPWIITGRGIKKDHEVKESVMTYDTAATIAWIFGLKTPQVWTGRPVKDIFSR